MKDYYGARGYPVGVEQKLYEVPGQPGIVQVNYEVQNDSRTTRPRRANHPRRERHHQGTA